MSVGTSSTSRTHRAERDVFRVRLGDDVYRIDPTATNPFDRVDDPPRAYKNTPTTGQLPSFGEEYDSCGEGMKHFCGDCGRLARNEDGEVAEIGQTCWRRECPRCANGGVMRSAYTPASKLESLRKQVYHERGEADSPKFHHVSITFPSMATASKDPDEAAWSLAKTVLDEVAIGYQGALLVHHPYSGEDGDDRDEWKRRLFSDRDWDDVEDELKVRHHMHAIVLADSVEHYLCESVADRTNNAIVTHRVEQRNGNSNVSLYDTEDLAGALTYALSHAREDADADAYRYTGRLANHTADDQTAAQMREVVRSVAPRTLDLDLNETTCGHDSEDDDLESSGPRFGGGDGDGGDAETSDTTPRCGGRLVPIEHAPSFIGEVEYSDTLRKEYTRWNGAPPPD